MAGTDDQVRPDHYGGEQNPFEPIKIIRYYRLSFELGNALKYLLRAGRKPGVPPEEDLYKLKTYVDFELQRIQMERSG